MEQHTQARSLDQYTKLTDRTLWFDGDSSYEPIKLLKAIRKHNVKYVTGVTPEIKEYNRNVPRGSELKVKTECRELDLTWDIPDEFKHLNVVEYLCDKHIQMTEGMDPAEADERDIRLLTEIQTYKRMGLFDVLRAIIWLINNLTAHSVVWGVGRGSSVASYVLYVIGVHDVDSHAYQLDIDDFLHE